MTPEHFRSLLHLLQLDLQRAANGLPILMPRERAVATLQGLLAADRGAERLLGGAR